MDKGSKKLRLAYGLLVCLNVFDHKQITWCIKGRVQTNYIFINDVQYPVGYATWLALPGARDSNQLCAQVYQRQLTRKSGTRRWVPDHQVLQRIKIPGNGRQSNTPHPVMTSTTNIWSNGQNNINIIMWVYSQNMHAFRDFDYDTANFLSRICALNDFTNTNSETSGLILLFRIAFQTTTPR